MQRRNVWIESSEEELKYVQMMVCKCEIYLSLFLMQYNEAVDYTAATEKVVTVRLDRTQEIIELVELVISQSWVSKDRRCFS